MEIVDTIYLSFRHFVINLIVTELAKQGKMKHHHLRMMAHSLKIEQPTFTRVHLKVLHVHE